MKSINPEKDNRYRVSKSASIYVAYSNIYNNVKNDLHFSIIDSCERVVFGVKGKEGEYIRYQNHAYRLYSADSLAEIVNRARNKELNFIHFSGVSSNEFPSTLEQLKLAPYCILDSSQGHFYKL